MPRKRISAQARRASILLASRAVFAERGYDGAKTQHIAAAAKISEALLFRHFPTKRALYRAVMEHLVREQNSNMRPTRLPEPNTRSLLEVIWEYLRDCLNPSAAQREGDRFLFASLGGDGSYARFIFGRAVELMEEPVSRAMAAAARAGDISGSTPDPVNVSLFIAHIGEVISLSRKGKSRSVPYQGDDDAVLKDAFTFCCRAMGVTDAALRTFLSDRGSSDAAAPATKRRVAPAGRRKTRAV